MKATDLPTGTLTIRQLRTLLFDLDNQEMTVKELRELLFNITDQDTPMRFYDFHWEINKAAKRERTVKHSPKLDAVYASTEEWAG